MTVESEKIDICEALWNGEKAIGCFIYGNTWNWAIDEKYNFCLNGELEFQAYLSKGRITYEQYLDACKRFRDGFLKLDESNFKSYRQRRENIFYNKDFLRGVYECNVGEKKRKEFTIKIENEKELRNVMSFSEILFSRLPSFYINFDKKQYYHTDMDRIHEESVWCGWKGMYKNFLDLIPATEKYWMFK